MPSARELLEQADALMRRNRPGAGASKTTSAAPAPRASPAATSAVEPPSVPDTERRGPASEPAIAERSASSGAAPITAASLPASATSATGAADVGDPAVTGEASIRDEMTDAELERPREPEALAPAAPTPQYESEAAATQAWAEAPTVESTPYGEPVALSESPAWPAVDAEAREPRDLEAASGDVQAWDVTVGEAAEHAPAPDLRADPQARGADLESIADDVTVPAVARLRGEALVHERPDSETEAIADAAEALIVDEALLRTSAAGDTLATEDAIAADVPAHPVASEAMTERTEADALHAAADEGASPEAATHAAALPETALHETGLHETALHDAATHEPATHEPEAHEPTTHEPATHEPATHEPEAHEPATHEPEAQASAAQGHPALDEDDIPLLTAVVEEHELAPSAGASPSATRFAEATPASLDGVPLLTDEVEEIEAPSIVHPGDEEGARGSHREATMGIEAASAHVEVMPKTSATAAGEALDAPPPQPGAMAGIEEAALADIDTEVARRASSTGATPGEASGIDVESVATNSDGASLEAAILEAARIESAKIEAERREASKVDAGIGEVTPAAFEVATMDVATLGATATAGAPIEAANEASAIDVSDVELAEIERALPVDREAALARVRQDTAALEADLDLQAAALEIEDAATLEVVALSDDELDTFAAWAHPVRHEDESPTIAVEAVDEAVPATTTLRAARDASDAGDAGDVGPTAWDAPEATRALSVPPTDGEGTPLRAQEARPSPGGTEPAPSSIVTPSQERADVATQALDALAATATATAATAVVAHAAVPGLAHALSPDEAAHLLVLPETALRGMPAVESPVQAPTAHEHADDHGVARTTEHAPVHAEHVPVPTPSHDEARGPALPALDQAEAAVAQGSTAAGAHSGDASPTIAAPMSAATQSAGSAPSGDEAAATAAHAAEAIESEEAAMAALEGGLAPEAQAPTPAPGAIGTTEQADTEASWAGPASVHWDALAEDVRMQVLQRLDIFTDSALKSQLAAHLQPIVDRASAELVESINREVGQLLRAYVAEAVEREIDKWRGGAG